jgi:diaminobutyrate-2-oxoglutarate transaminase
MGVAAGEPLTVLDYDEIVDRRESAVRSYCRTIDIIIKSAAGSIVRDRSGREYIDFLSGAGALNYGHNNPRMKSALLQYVERDGIAHGLDIMTEAKAEFMHAVEAHLLTPRGMDHRMQFTGPTGTDAVEAALKLARKVTGRTNVIAFTNGYHGVTQGSLAATGSAHHRMTPALGLSGVTRMPYDGYLGPETDTTALLRRLLTDPSSGVDAPAAILLETVQGEGGLNVATDGWLQEVQAIAQHVGALLIVDDVQAGCGRTGTFFSTEPSGVTPDLIVLSKSLSGYGIPLSMVLIRPEYDVWLPGETNGTFRGNAHGFVTGAVALNEFWADGSFTIAIESRAAQVRMQLEELAGLLPGSQVKGRGMMLGLDLRLGATARRVQRACIDHGLLIECCGPDDEILKIMAPLTTSPDLLDKGLSIIRQATLDIVDPAA